MANETTTSVLSELLPSIVAEAMFQAQERSIMRNLVKNYTMGANNGKTITVPKWVATAAGDLTEGTDMSNTQLNTTSAVLTVSEVGVMSTVTDLALRTSATNVVADAGRLMGEAIAKKIDQDLLGEFANLAAAIGDGTGQISAASIFEAVAKLRNNGVSGADLFCVVHPYVAYDIKSGLTNTFAGHAGDLSNEALRTGYVGTIAGVNIFESSNISDTAGDSLGAVFHRDALGLAMMQDINIETQRDASLRATELVATAVYGTGVLFDNYGFGMNFDSSIV
jgi:N4-gp56 family major capsid protein